MVVAARGEEGRCAEVQYQVEAHHIAVEPNGAFEVGHFEVHVADVGVGGEPGGGCIVCLCRVSRVCHSCFTPSLIGPNYLPDVKYARTGQGLLLTVDRICNYPQLGKQSMQLARPSLLQR